MAGRTRSVVLVCEVCGDRVVLLGPLSAWRSEGAVFGCECGTGLTLADPLGDRTIEPAAVPDAQKAAPLTSNVGSPPEPPLVSGEGGEP